MRLLLALVSFLSLVTFLGVRALHPVAVSRSAAGAPHAAPRLFQPELRVLHELDGESAGDQFGWLGRSLGDCDGDGVNDLVLAAPTRANPSRANPSRASSTGANGGEAAGRVYVYSGKSAELLFTRDGEPGDLLGWCVEAAGDVDGDGRADVIAGAPGALDGAGRAWVLSGEDGSVLHALKGAAAGDGFGRKVAGAGDTDGDGFDDFLVGADTCDSTGVDAGRAYLYSGRDGRLLLALDGENAGDKFGVSLCAVTLAGETLIAAGAADAGAQHGGRVYLFRRAKGDGGKESAELRYALDADETGVGLGHLFLSFVGDVDGDGTPDLYVSDWENAAKGPKTGRVYVYSGRREELLLTLTGEKAGDGFGLGHADVGDVDGDGSADLLIGARQDAEGAGGKCSLYSGRGGELLDSWECLQEGETFGFDTTGVGDLDGDGALDYLITSAWSGASGFMAGRAFVVAGSRTLSVAR